MIFVIYTETHYGVSPFLLNKTATALLDAGNGMIRQRRGKGRKERRRVIKRVDVRSTNTDVAWREWYAAQQSCRDNDSKRGSYRQRHGRQASPEDDNEP
jgi:hypothetical protein